MTDLTQSYWPIDASSAILDLTVGDLLRQAAEEAPDRDALISFAPGRSNRVWTYAELLDDAERAAAWLLTRFSTGDAVVVWAPNVPEWLVLQYGAALAGLVLVTANPALRGDELAHVIRQSESVGVFSVEEFRGTDMRALLDEVLATFSPDLPVMDLGEWLEEVRVTPRLEVLPDVSPEAPTQIQFTSGTTGRAKAAVLRHRAMVTNAAYVRRRCGARFGATFATALPLFHTAGCGLSVMGAFHERATLVLGEIFEPRTVLRALAEHRAEIFGGVPLMLHAVLAEQHGEPVDLSALQVVMSGGDLVPPALVDGWFDTCGVAASSVYGQTELSPVICQTSPGDSRTDALYTAGLPLPQVEVAVMDPVGGGPVPIGTEGEVCARGYQVMIGYHGMPETTEQTIDDQGWLHTGDLGSMDARGYLMITGRLKDLIIRGGENIYPREVEEVLVKHSAVVNAVVIGRPDGEWGEQVAAVLLLDPAVEEPTAAHLRDFVRTHIAPHKTPRYWYLADELPTNAMGKLQKFRLRDRIERGDIRQLAGPD